MPTPRDQPRTGHSDWSPDQYLLFRDARNRPIHDLLTFLGRDFSPARIVDLGCGPGTSTEILASRFPHAIITGIDSSPAMLAKARETLPELTFTEENLLTYTPDPGTDLLFANAVFHWLPAADRIHTITRLLLTQVPGSGVLALQVPDNYNEPTHRLMRETAVSEGPWTAYFSSLTSAGNGKSPALDPIESELAYYNALKPHCRAVEMWTTRYVHALERHGEIVEWVRGTGLRPFLDVLPVEEGVREAFLDEYKRRLEEAYPRAGDGRVLLGYPRRFVVAFR